MASSSSPVELTIPVDSLPDAALLRERHLLSGIVPFSSATLWRRVKAKSFPQPVRIGSITAWRWGEVRAWLEAQGRDAA